MDVQIKKYTKGFWDTGAEDLSKQINDFLERTGVVLCDVTYQTDSINGQHHVIITYTE